jgi:hypothetical protein
LGNIATINCMFRGRAQKASGQPQRRRRLDAQTAMAPFKTAELTLPKGGSASILFSVPSAKLKRAKSKPETASWQDAFKSAASHLPSSTAMHASVSFSTASTRPGCVFDHRHSRSPPILPAAFPLRPAPEPTLSWRPDMLAPSGRPACWQSGPKSLSLLCSAVCRHGDASASP